MCRNIELIPGQHKLLKLTPSHCILYLLLSAMDLEISLSHFSAGSIPIDFLNSTKSNLISSRATQNPILIISTATRNYEHYVF
jgi:hypothetical protein